MCYAQHIGFYSPSRSNGMWEMWNWLPNTMAKTRVASWIFCGSSQPTYVDRNERVKYTPIDSRNSTIISAILRKTDKIMFSPFSSRNGRWIQGSGASLPVNGLHKRLPPITYHYTTKSKKIQIFDLSFPLRMKKLRKNVTKTESFCEN